MTQTHSKINPSPNKFPPQEVAVLPVNEGNLIDDPPLPPPRQVESSALEALRRMAMDNPQPTILAHFAQLPPSDEYHVVTAGTDVGIFTLRYVFFTPALTSS